MYRLSPLPLTYNQSVCTLFTGAVLGLIAIAGCLSEGMHNTLEKQNLQVSLIQGGKVLKGSCTGSAAGPVTTPSTFFLGKLVRELSAACLVRILPKIYCK